jgi:hypothetical protein
MPVSVTPHTAGEALPLGLSAAVTGSSVLPDFSTEPVTVVIDGPLAEPLANPTPADYPRGEYRWRPAGTSDAQFELVDDELVFTLSPADSAELFTHSGRWLVRWLVGPVATQDEIGKNEIAVDVPAAGPLPTVDP